MKICIFFVAATLVAGVLVDAFTELESTSLEAVSAGVNNFTNYFYESLALQKKGNFICSPLSVHMVLSMIALGAKGNTKRQLKSSLGFPEHRTVVQIGYNTLIRSFKNVEQAELKVASKIFVNNLNLLEPTFQTTVSSYFESEVQSINFRNASQSAKIINDWCAKNTNNHITKLFAPEDIENPEMVLVNAIYFKGKWLKKFNKESTSYKPFYLDDNTIKEVPMMRNSEYFNTSYDSELHVSLLELPYQGNDGIKMLILLPDISTTLREVENNIHNLNLSSIAWEEDTTFVSLPKFKVKSTLDLKPALQNMGITEIFGQSADLSDIMKGSELKVDKVIQKAYIEVDEEGSEAAVATGVELITLSAPPEFKVNKPFLFMIVKNENPLFIVRVTDPTEMSA